MEKVSMAIDGAGEDGLVTVNERGTADRAASTRSSSGGKSVGSSVVRKGEPSTVPKSLLKRGFECSWWECFGPRLEGPGWFLKEFFVGRRGGVVAMEESTQPTGLVIASSFMSGVTTTGSVLHILT
jgi:hypothetical protein